MIYSSTKHYSIYSLLISLNKMKYVQFKLHSSKNSSQHNQSFIGMSSIYCRHGRTGLDWAAAHGPRLVGGPAFARLRLFDLFSYMLVRNY